MNHASIKQQSSWRNNWHIWLLAAICLIIFCHQMYLLMTKVMIPIFTGQLSYYGDNQVYRKAGLRFLCDPMTLYIAKDRLFSGGFTYPPLSILFFLPFVLLPLPIASLLFAILIYITLAGAVWLCKKIYEYQSNSRLNIRTQALCFLIAFAFTPVFMNATAGQVNTIVLFLCLAYIWLAHQRKSLLAGIILSLAIWIKLYPIVFILLSFYRKDYFKTIAGVASGLVFLPVIFSSIVPLGLYKYYFSEALPYISGQVMGHVSSQSLQSALMRLYIPFDYFKTWNNITVLMPIKIANVLLFIFLLIFIYRLKKYRCDFFGIYILSFIPMVIALGWGHTYVLVLPLILFVIVGAQSCSLRVKLISLALFLAFVQPSYSFMPFEIRFPVFMRYLFYSRYLLATLASIFLGSHIIKNMQKTRT